MFFVPADDDREIWKATLRNASGRPRRLSVVGYVEFALGHALVDLINQCDDQHFNRVRFEKGLDALFATKTYWVTETRGTQHQENKEWDRWAFFTVNRPVAAYETVRERFIGPFRSESDPEGLEKGLSSKDMDCGNAVGALQVDLELGAGESADVVFSLGVIAKPEFERTKAEVVGKYRDAAAVDAALARVAAGWDRFLGHARAATPDPEADVFLNYWIPYQAKVAFDVGRVASFYYWGIGRGFGYRDTAQDTIAIVIADAARARARVGLLARQMRRDGQVYHHFYGDGQGEFTGALRRSALVHPGGHRIPQGDGRPRAARREGAVPRRGRGDGPRPSPGRGPLRRGGPRAPTACRSSAAAIGTTRSITSAARTAARASGARMFYVAMLNRLLELLASPEGAGEASRTSARCGTGWSRRSRPTPGTASGTCGPSARPAGRSARRRTGTGRSSSTPRAGPSSPGCRTGTGWSGPWTACRDRLDTPFGPKICAPAFREIDPTIGLITRCVWGKKENGAVFCHPAAWVVQAECLLGRGGRGLRDFKKLLPGRIDQTVFSAEPYVYSQYITSDEHETAGRASHSWQTGTAAWMYRVAYDHILGLRPSYGGLVVDPVIPRVVDGVQGGAGLPRARATSSKSRTPKASKSGVASIAVDGRPIDGQVIAPRPAGTVCRVSVTMGRTA